MANLSTRFPDLSPPLGEIGGAISHPSGATYEDLLELDPRWALSEGSLHFEGNNAVFHALHKVTRRLIDLEIPYAVVGGMALFKHGLRRFTEDVDILVTKESLKLIHEKLEGPGYVPPFARSKHLRDVELKVKIEFLVTGEYPGDGKVKPVAFPDPRLVGFEADGITYINLPTIVELKLASGMTNPGRMKDLSDVLELIKARNLPADFAQQLNPFVREKYAELWKSGRRTFEMIWRNKSLTLEAQSLDEMIATLRRAAETLEEMRAQGVALDPHGGTRDDYATLVTTDPDVARTFGFHEREDYWDEGAGDNEV